MAQEQFLGNPQETYLKGLVGSIVTRVMLICLILLVIPLAVHTLWMYRDNYASSLKETLTNLGTISRADNIILNQMISEKINDAKTVANLLKLTQFDASISSEARSQLSASLAEVAIEQGYSSLFYQVLSSNGEAEILLSANPERLEKRFSDTAHYHKVKALGTLVYLASDLVKNEETLFIDVAFSDPVTENIKGILTIGVSAQWIVEKLVRFQAVQLPLIVAFLQTDGSIFVASDPYLYKQKLYSYTQQDITSFIQKNSDEVPDGLDKTERDDYIGAQTPVGGDSFYLLVAIPKSSIFGAVKKNFSLQILRLSFFFFLIGGGGVFFLIRRITKPLKDLARAMQKVADGDLEARYHPDAMGFEINMLGKDFNRMVETLTHHIQESKDQRLAKDLLQKEFDIGRKIQKALLPKTMPSLLDIDFSASFIPASEVAGDFYDIYQRKDGKLVIAIADASGKGISACLYSLSMRSILRSFEYSLGSLQEVLSKTNELFCLDTGSSGFFVTLWVGILDVETKELEYSSCGHLPALLCGPSGQIQELVTPGTALGVIANVTIVVNKIQLKDQDTLLLYTDGLIEAQSVGKEFYGLGRLKKALQGQAKSSIGLCIKEVVVDVEQYSKGNGFDDDLTILGIRLDSLKCRQS